MTYNTAVGFVLLLGQGRWTFLLNTVYLKSEFIYKQDTQNSYFYEKNAIDCTLLFCMNVLAVNEKVTVWKASASGSSGSEHVKGLKNADGSDGSDAFQGSDGNFFLIRVSMIRGAGTAT